MRRAAGRIVNSPSAQSRRTMKALAAFAPRTRMRIHAFLGFVAVVAAACTVFDGLVAGDAGPADAGGDATMGDGAAPDAPVDAGNYPGFLSLEDAARVCSNMFKCPLLGASILSSVDVPSDSLNYTSCVGWMAGPIPPTRVGVAKVSAMLACAGKATTCKAAGECFWYSLLEPGEPLCAGDAGSARLCVNGGNDVYDCQAGFALHCKNALYQSGSTCIAGSDGVPWCSLGTPCTVQSQGVCQGSFDTYCGSNKLTYGLDCNVTGLTCGFDPGTSLYQCLTNGSYKTCMGAGVTCTGGTVVSVCDGNNLSTYDCNAIGGTCDDTALPRCKRPSDTCSPLDPSVNQCAGDVISLCVGGQPKTLDCTTVGLKCVAGMAGASAHCG